MFRWGRRRRRGQSRGCCVVVPIGCLMGVTTVLLFAGMVLARLL